MVGEPGTRFEMVDPLTVRRGLVGDKWSVCEPPDDEREDCLRSTMMIGDYINL